MSDTRLLIRKRKRDGIRAACSKVSAKVVIDFVKDVRRG